MGESQSDGSATVAVGAAVSTPDRELVGTPVGTSLGRYVVLEEIGRGGMGRVLRAYDPKLQREVAVKELRRSVLGSAASPRSRRAESSEDPWMARLVTEARAMAQLSHPNVVGVYDVAELESGEVALVMEYVAGTTLRDSLKDPRPRWQEILGLFIEAGRGLEAAHAVGLLHRDFKPANVLVGTDGAVKVTDFGLAKDLATGASHDPSREGSPSASAGHTEEGTVMGTPRYMAPEQHTGDVLTPAADQFAFCVALWEGLCTTAPYAGKDLAVQKVQGPPAWPETSTPRPIVEAILRGLSPCPGDRWPSIEALLAVLAFDPIRRRSRWLRLASGSALAGVGLLGWHSWSANQASICSGGAQQLQSVWGDSRRAEVRDAIHRTGIAYAPTVWERTAAELDAYATAWVAMHADACEATTVRGEQSAAVMDLRMACLQRSKVELDAVAGVLETADADVVERAHQVVGRLRPLWRCEDVAGLQLDVEPPDPRVANAVATARARLARAGAERKAGRYSRAQDGVEAAEQILHDVDYGPVQTELALVEGQVLADLGKYDAAETSLDRALELAARWRQTEQMAEASADLTFVVGHEQKRSKEGLRLAMVAKALANGPSERARALDRLAAVLDAQGRAEEAEAAARAALVLRSEAQPPDQLALAISHNNLGSVLFGQARFDEAQAEFTQSLELLSQSLGPDHPNVIAAHHNLAGVMYAQGKHADAEAEIRRVLTQRLEVFGPDHPDVAEAHSGLAAVLFVQGKLEEAEAAYRRALAIREKALGPDHPEVEASRKDLADLLQAK